MFIRQLDFLSPYITLYHKGDLSHNSIFSGILSIITIILLVVLALYYVLEIINRTNPNAFYFNRFIEEAGFFYLNRTTLFHFIRNIKNIQGNTINVGFDYTTFNIIGSYVYYNNFIMPPPFVFDHWLYGNCDKETNTEGLDDILTDDLLQKAACVRKYYNASEGKYYSIGDPQFIWPNISHGTFNEKNVLYNIMIRPCDNRLIGQILGEGSHCQIGNNYFDEDGTKVLHFYFINNYINILNYDNPNTHFFYRIESPFSSSQYTVNDINIAPALVKTHNGLIFDNIKEETSYIFDRNDVYIRDSNDGTNLYMVYGFFLKNIQEYYERTYKRIQDVISSIGGIIQAITLIAICINSFYNNYIVLSDTEVLLNSSNWYENQINKKNVINYKSLNNELKSTKRKDKSNDIINSETIIEIQLKHSKKRNKTEKDIDINNISKSNHMLNNNIKDEVEVDKSKVNNIENTNINNNCKEKEREMKEKGGEKTFCNYLLYKITCGKKKDFYNTYKKFRFKIISEEHMIRNDLNIYNLMKIKKRKNDICSYSFSKSFKEIASKNFKKYDIGDNSYEIPDKKSSAS